MRKIFKFLAREFVAVVKCALITGSIALVVFIMFYVTKQPDYYTPQEISADRAFNDSVKNAFSTHRSLRKTNKKHKYSEYENLEQPTVITGHRGIQSEYAVSVVAGEDLDLVNTNVKSNFLDHISHDSSVLFLVIFSLLVVCRYSLMIYRYSKSE